MTDGDLLAQADEIMTSARRLFDMLATQRDQIRRLESELEAIAAENRRLKDELETMGDADESESHALSLTEA